jgi:hypothetical protein
VSGLFFVAAIIHQSKKIILIDVLSGATKAQESVVDAQQIPVKTASYRYTSSIFCNENACVGAPNKTLTLPHTSLNNSEFL